MGVKDVASCCISNRGAVSGSYEFSLVFCLCVGQFAGRFAGRKEEVFFFVESCLSLRTITEPRWRRGKKAGGKGRKESLSFLQVFVFL